MEIFALFAYNEINNLREYIYKLDAGWQQAYSNLYNEYNFLNNLYYESVRNYSQLYNYYQQVSDEYIKTQKQYSELYKIYQTTQHEITRLNIKNDELKNQNQSLKDTLDQLNTTIREQETKITELNNQIISLKNTCIKYRDIIINQNKYIEYLTSELEKKTITVDNQTKLLEDQTKYIEKLNKLNVSQKDEINKLQSNIKILKDGLVKISETYINTMKGVKTSIEQLNSKYNDLMIAYIKTIQDNEKSKQEIDYLKTYNKLYTEQVISLSSAVNDLNNNLLEANEEITLKIDKNKIESTKNQLNQKLKLLYNQSKLLNDYMLAELLNDTSTKSNIHSQISKFYNSVFNTTILSDINLTKQDSYVIELNDLKSYINTINNFITKLEKNLYNYNENCKKIIELLETFDLININDTFYKYELKKKYLNMIRSYLYNISEYVLKTEDNIILPSIKKDILDKPSFKDNIQILSNTDNFKTNPNKLRNIIICKNDNIKTILYDPKYDPNNNSNVNIELNLTTTTNNFTITANTNISSETIPKVFYNITNISGEGLDDLKFTFEIISPSKITDYKIVSDYQIYLTYHYFIIRMNNNTNTYKIFNTSDYFEILFVLSNISDDLQTKLKLNTIFLQREGGLYYPDNDSQTTYYKKIDNNYLINNDNSKEKYVLINGIYYKATSSNTTNGKYYSAKDNQIYTDYHIIDSIKYELVSESDRLNGVYYYKTGSKIIVSPPTQKIYDTSNDLIFNIFRIYNTDTEIKTNENINTIYNICGEKITQATKDNYSDTDFIKNTLIHTKIIDLRKLSNTISTDINELYYLLLELIYINYDKSININNYISEYELYMNLSNVDFQDYKSNYTSKLDYNIYDSLLKEDTEIKIKKIHELNETNNELNETNNELNKTNNELNKTNNELNETNNELNKTNNELNETNNELNKTNNELNETNNTLASNINNIKNSMYYLFGNNGIFLGCDKNWFENINDMNKSK